MRNGFQRLFRIAARACLNQPLRLFRLPPCQPHRPVKADPVEPLLIDIAQEIGGGDRRVATIEIEDYRSHAGSERHPDQPLTVGC